MSFEDTITAAHSYAHATLAQMQGMVAGGTNCLLASGQKVRAVYGNPQAVFVPAPGGGYRKKHTLDASVTTDQLAAPPPDQSRIVRTDVSPVQPYILDYVTRDGPYTITLHLARYGEK